MTSVDILDEYLFDSFVPAVRNDVVIRHYGQEAIVWSPIGSRPIRLDPVGSIILQLLDGVVSVSELADDINAVVGVPRSVALSQLRAVIGHLDVAGSLTSSAATPLAPPSDDLFYGPPNP